MTVTAPSDALPKLEKFELCEEIGHGGMATVYRAKDLRLGREVAVKIIHRHLRDNPEVATRFVSEARAAAKLKHRGIVEVYDVSSEEDREKYLVVELIRGCTLRKTLLEHRDMPAEIGAAIVAELCDAVEHAHAAGIIHRDIKPENVLIELPRDREKVARDAEADLDATSGTAPMGLRSVSRDDDGEEPRGAVSSKPASSKSGSSKSSKPESSSEAVARSSVRAGERAKSAKSDATKDPKERSSEPTPSRAPKSGRSSDVTIKLTDFGIAKVLDAQGVTSTGQVLGSPAHMAPEQIEGGDIDPRTDVFALGVLLYECMVGHLPFEGKNPAQVLRRVIEGQFSPADLERPTVGGRFAQIAAAALANKPDDRLETPQALGDELRKELSELGLGDPKVEIAAYFSDAERYIAELPVRVVPKLVTRGEAHRKARKVQLAASDFNRAHALSPDDPAILKRITNLTSSAGRERMMRRGAVLLAGALALGGLAYGVVRVVRYQTTRLNPTATTDLGPRNEPLPSALAHGPEPTARPQLSPSANVRPLRTAAVPMLPRPSVEVPVASQAPRPVTIGISPMGARLEVDGSPIDPLGKVFQLAPGSHPYALLPPTGSECCDKKTGTFTVVPASKDNPDEKQKVALALDLKLATVRVSGGPSGASVVCGQWTFEVGGQKDVALKSAEETVTCLFNTDTGTLKKPLKLKAGASTSLVWPAGG